jgi:thioredoxin-related protein
MVALTFALAAGALASERQKKGQFFGAMETTYPAWFKSSFLELQDDVAEASTLSRRVMLIFHQDGCPYCNALVERNLAQKDIEQLMREHFDVIAINMWGDLDVMSVDGQTFTEKTFAQALKVQFTPTLIFLDESGNAVLRLNGYLPPRRFKVALEFVASRKDKEMSYADYVARELPPSGHVSGKLIDEPYLQREPYALARGPGARPLAVLFEQTDCPNCETLHREVLSDPSTDALIRRFDVVQLDMWADTPVETPDGRRLSARAWARDTGITYAPSIVYFDAMGREVVRSESWFRIFHTQSMMDYVLSGAYREEPSFQRYLSTRAEAMREQGIDVDIWR